MNKTKHKLKLIEKELDVEEKETAHDLDSLYGQLCLADISPNKKYKIAIINEEYMVDNLRVKNFEMAKLEVAYESEWFMLKDEPVSPFYRQKSAMLNCLFLVSKCWIDLKLYPAQKSQPQQAMYKQICFVLSNDQDDEKPSSSYSSTASCKVLTIRSKFLIKNQTQYEIKFKLLNDFMRQHETNKLLSRYIQLDENLVKPGDLAYGADEIVSKRCFYLHDKKSLEEATEDEDDSRDELAKDIKRQQDNLNDIFYFNLECLNDTLQRQSKPLILTCNEKSLKQISTHTQSNENFLLSRQCFSLYNDQMAPHLATASTKALILTQKLLVEQNGQLVVAINEDRNVLVNLHNTIGLDMYVWPRISSNFILENYVKNARNMNEKALSELIKEEGGKKAKIYSSLRRTNSLKNMMMDDQLALNFMHFIPAGSLFKFNYDFIGNLALTFYFLIYEKGCNFFSY